ncbi:MAG: transketolase family protein [Oscillospiraceae bacterium]|nr:transketolase family protein [Oscillospiraceae bacterium]
MSELTKILDQRVEDKVAMRDAYCDSLIELAEKDKRILAIEVDVANSMGTNRFASKFPSQSIACGIQEANALSMASGLSKEGFIPFFHAFGIFATRRVFDQAFLSCGYAKAPVKIIGGDAGVTASANGGTHMPLEDMALMRSIPDAIVIEPADTVTIRALLPQIAQADVVCYVRSCRKQVIRIYDDSAQFKIGKANILREGKDASIFACGIMVHEALTAAETLEKEGISVRVVDFFTVKPLDNEMVHDSAAKTGAIVTAENHSVTGALGSAVAEYLSENIPTPLERIGVRDSYGEVGDVPYLMKRFDLTADDIVKSVKKAIARKK